MVLVDVVEGVAAAATTNSFVESDVSLTYDGEMVDVVTTDRCVCVAVYDACVSALSDDGTKLVILKTSDDDYGDGGALDPFF